MELERRLGKDRRKVSDRRHAFIFDIVKPERRSGEDRRKQCERRRYLRTVIDLSAR